MCGLEVDSCVVSSCTAFAQADTTVPGAFLERFQVTQGGVSAARGLTQWLLALEIAKAAGASM
jgi:hypothetical protein